MLEATMKRWKSSICHVHLNLWNSIYLSMKPSGAFRGSICMDAQRKWVLDISFPNQRDWLLAIKAIYPIYTYSIMYIYICSLIRIKWISTSKNFEICVAIGYVDNWTERCPLELIDMSPSELNTLYIDDLRATYRTKSVLLQKPSRALKQQLTEVSSQWDKRYRSQAGAHRHTDIHFNFVT